MENQETTIFEKFINFYSEIFEKELLEEILKVSHFEKVKSGELLIDVGDDMTHLPLLIDGVVKIMRPDKDDEEIVLYFLEPGDTCTISFVNCINKKKSI